MGRAMGVAVPVRRDWPEDGWMPDWVWEARGRGRGEFWICGERYVDGKRVRREKIDG
jgi:hypothetical protein